MDASIISQMKALEDENRRLKKMYAEMSMQAELLKEALGKKRHGHLNAGSLTANASICLSAKGWPGKRWRCAG